MDIPQEYHRIIRNICYGVVRKCWGQVERDDLIQAGYLGLLTALHRFNAFRNSDFHSYAQMYIYWAIMSEMRFGLSVAYKWQSIEEEVNGDIESDYRDQLDAAMAAEIYRHVSRLPGNIAEIIERRYIHGESDEEIAEVKGWGTTWVWALRKRGLAMLRDSLDRGLCTSADGAHEAQANVHRA